MGAAGRGAIWHQGIFGVTPGELLFARHVVTCDASAPADSLVLAGFNFFDRTGTLLSAPNDAINAEGSGATAAQAFNVAFRAEGKATVPAGAAFARAYSIRAGGAGELDEAGFLVHAPGGVGELEAPGDLALADAQVRPRLGPVEIEIHMLACPRRDGAHRVAGPFAGFDQAAHPVHRHSFPHHAPGMVNTAVNNPVRA
jgi:hypothetical protein